MFLRVYPEELVIGTKYKIMNPAVEFEECSGVFKELTSNYARVIVSKKEIVVSNFVVMSHNYYVFISDQPQWKMERRAVNLIMRRLIGDDCFEW